MRLARAFVLILIVVLCFSLLPFLHLNMRDVSAAPSTTDSAGATGPSISVLNPGPDSYPSAWNASSTVRYVGTPDFDFYSNETSPGSTFFMNVTVTNVTDLFAWSIGIVYDNASLEFVRAWFPADNVFAGAVNAGAILI